MASLDIQHPKKNRPQRSLLSKGLSLSVLTLFSRVLGLLREMTKAKFLGTSAFSDAFGIAFMIPNLFRRLFAENSISVAFIPTFKGYLENAGTPDGKKTAENFISSTFTLVTFLTVIFVLAGMAATPLILRLFYSTQNREAWNEAIVLTRIMFPYLAIISVAAFFQGILNGLKIFSPSGFTPILFNAIVVIFTYALSPYTANPARAMAIGVVAGGAVQAAFQLPFVLKNGWRVTFTSLKASFTNPGTRTVLRLVGPTVIGMAAYQLNDLVSSMLAARAGEGVVSSLQYSLRLQELILGICAVTIGTVILPDLTGFAKQNDWAQFNRMLSLAINIMALIAIPISFYAFIMGRELITLVFATGRFDEHSVELTLKVFRFHIVALFFIAVNRIVSPAFYAQQDTKSPTAAGMIGFAVNIVLAFTLVRILGGSGIALALSLASFVNTIVLFLFLSRSPTVNVKTVVRSSLVYAIRIALFSAAASVPMLILKSRFCALFNGHTRLVSQGGPVLCTAALFAAIGLFLLAFTKDPLLKHMLNIFKAKRSTSHEQH